MFCDLPHDRGNSFGRQCKSPPLRGTALKRVFDVTSASLGLLLLLPVLATVAIGGTPELSWPGAVPSIRVGFGGRTSSCSSSGR